jgi:hypothetical protein
VDRFYGIEYEEFPAQIAQVAMWLIDHQMNMKASETFGAYYVRLPLRKSATIVHGNALRIDWQSLIDPLPWDKGEAKYDYILGNPPFIGHHYQTKEQKEDMGLIFKDVNGTGVLDYVSAWYIKAAQYMQQSEVIASEKKQSHTKAAFVSTNSISQGEQVGILWNELFNKYKIKIHFAHRTFSWKNEAKGNAAVHVVIIGFAIFDSINKRLFEYDDIKSEPHETLVRNINPYLVDASDIIISNRSEPLSNVPKMVWGNKPTDGGNFLFENDSEKDEFLKKEPKAIKWIRQFMSGGDLINSRRRWCLWLQEISPDELRDLKEVMKRVEYVKRTRLDSKSELTRKKASTPTLFAQIAQPKSDYLAIPEVSSEKRKYIPIAYLAKEIIASNTIQLVPEAQLWNFGILTSLMHMVWTKHVCGKLESRFRYSNTIVYNNFPWPETPTDKQIKTVEDAAQAVLNARAVFPNASLADLYDPNIMPAPLVKAHQQLDKAVDHCYRPQPFPNETKRIEFLFQLYDKYTSSLFVGEKMSKSKIRQSTKK